MLVDYGPLLVEAVPVAAAEAVRLFVPTLRRHILVRARLDELPATIQSRNFFSRINRRMAAASGTPQACASRSSFWRSRASRRTSNGARFDSGLISLIRKDLPS